jgi:uncharacterized protein YaiI (UPF0178 family)
MTTILIDKYVTLHQGITSEEGEPIYKLIIEALSKDEDVVLDFEGILFLTTAFLNVMIGALYKDYTSEQLQEKLHISHINEDTAARIKKVTDNAKLFYSDQDKFNETVDNSIYGNL